MKKKVLSIILSALVLASTATMFTGCGKETATPDEVPVMATVDEATTEVTTEPTEETKPTVSEEVKEAVKDNGLKVNDKGEVVDGKGNKVEVKDGKVEVKTDDGKTVTVKVDEVKEVTQPTKGSSSEPKETKATQPTKKPAQPATQATKKPATSNTKPATSNTKPATPTTTPKPTEATKATEAIWHPAVTKQVWVVDKEAYTYEEPVYETQRRTICCCGADLTGLSNSEVSAHLKAHALNGENGSYSVKNVQVQVGTKTVTVPEEGHWETVVVKKGYWEYK